jgi:hypothetical protein
MPQDYGVRFDQNQGIGPIRPQPPQRNPEQSIESVQLRARLLALINGKLLPKGGSLQAEIVVRYRGCSQVRQRRGQKRNHPSDATELDDSRFETLLNLSILFIDDILTTHRSGASISLNTIGVPTGPETAAPL